MDFRQSKLLGYVYERLLNFFLMENVQMYHPQNNQEHVLRKEIGSILTLKKVQKDWVSLDFPI